MLVWGLDGTCVGAHVCVGMHGFYFRFAHVFGLLAHFYMYHVCTWCLQRSEEGVGSFGTKVRSHGLLCEATREC